MKRILTLLLTILAVTGFSQSQLPLKRAYQVTGTRISATTSSTTSAGRLLLPIKGKPSVDNTYTLAQGMRTSAGVFKGDVLVRTLWSMVTKPAGTHSVDQVWDYRDDDGNLLPNDIYSIQVAATNATYNFLGTVGNTSKNKGGSTTYPTGEHIMGMTIADGKAWIVNGYVEGEPTHAYFDLTDPQARIETLAGEGNAWHLIDQDDTKIWYAGTDHGNDDVSTRYGIVATNRTTPYAQSTLAGGSPWATTGVDLDYSSAVNITTDPIRGLAVQQSGNYYACSHPTLNVVRVFNKTTGASVDYSITNPRSLEFSSDGTALWIISGTNTVAKYAFSGGGVLTTTPTLTLSGLDTPIYLTISPTTGTMAVQDAGARQQIRFFHPGTGVEGTPLGQLGGYANSEVVAWDKFMFKNTKDYGPLDDGDGHPYCEIDPNGHIWVGEGGCLRSEHISLTDPEAPTLIETIQFMGYQYSAYANPAEPERVFSGYQEFHVDHSKNSIEGANGSWTYVANWGEKITDDKDDEYQRFRGMTTTSNGRTYALLRKNLVYVEVELTPNFGVRLTGNQTPNLLWDMFTDGSWWSSSTNTLGAPSVYQRRMITGFDIDNNPIRGDPVTMASTPNVTATDPITTSGLMLRNTLTSSNILLTFDRGKYNSTTGRGAGYHIGGVKLGEAGWKFRIAPSTHTNYIGEYPKDGYYDIGNGVKNAGGVVQAVGRHGLWNYFGEFWKSEQTNEFHHFYDNGLYLGTFGMTRTEAYEAGEATPGMAGNASSFTMLDIGGGKIRVTHGDEFFRGGTSVWEMDNLGVDLYTFPITKTSDTPNLPAPVGTDLLAGLAYNDVVDNNTAGWTRSPATEGPQTGFTQWSVRTNKLTYRQQDRDIYMESRPNTAPSTATLSRDLGNSVRTSWEIKGRLGYSPNSEQQNNLIQILDHTGKIIVQISRPQLTGTTMAVLANSTTLVTNTYALMAATLRKLQPLSIRRSGSNVIVDYGDYSATVALFDSGADITRPTTLLIKHENAAGNVGHVTALEDLTID